MDIYLHNTLSGAKEKFDPLVPGQVGMYNCGPTVYNYAHIGNLRSYVFADTLRRMFEWNGYDVTQVINITDVGHMTLDGAGDEDKMEKGAEREGKTAAQIADFYTEQFFGDLDQLNILRDRIVFPRATEYVAEQIAMIEELERGGYTYRISDGVYFDTSKFPDYGKLGNINLAGLEEGARIGINAEKKHPTDFVLWKFSPTDRVREMEWQSPWGVGFPGWHIECSAMSKKLLGVTFDIHTGGVDHIPVHHNNEIAQSVCANHAPFVRYWLHNAFLTIGKEEKMSKSDENFIRLATLTERGIEPLAYRYLLLTARYSSPLQFSWEALEGAQTALKRLRNSVNEDNNPDHTNLISEERYQEFRSIFNEYINDNLNTPAALEILWDVARSKNMLHEKKRKLILDFDRVLGLDLGRSEDEESLPADIQTLVAERDKARAEKDFARSDALRADIEARGFDVKDTADGTRVTSR